MLRIIATCIHFGDQKVKYHLSRDKKKRNMLAILSGMLRMTDWHCITGILK